MPSFFNSKQFTEHYLPAPRLPWRFQGKESTCQCSWRGFDPWVEKIFWRRKWQPTPAFLPGRSRGNGQRSLARVRHDLATTTWLGRGLALKELKRQQANTLTGKTLWPGLWSWGDQGEEHRNFSMSVHWDSRCNTETLHSCISLFLKRTLKIV